MDFNKKLNDEELDKVSGGDDGSLGSMDESVTNYTQCSEYSKAQQNKDCPSAGYRCNFTLCCPYAK